MRLPLRPGGGVFRDGAALLPLLLVVAAGLLCSTVSAQAINGLAAGAAAGQESIGFLDQVHNGALQPEANAPKVSKKAYLEDRSCGRLHSIRHIDWHSMWNWRSWADVLEGFWMGDVSAVAC